MKKKTINILISSLMAVALPMTMLCACGSKEEVKKADEPAPAIEFVSPGEPELPPVTEEAEKPAEPTETAVETGRKDGERFEETIMLEGIEETVRYEHVINFVIGFEMDYDYESLLRQKGSDRERFVSIYDDPEKPMNYLEITYTDKDLDSASAAIGAQLSKDYDIVTEQGTLDKAGSCTMLETTRALTGSDMQTVYIVPAGDGSIVAAAHYTIESAEGFGRRFDHIANTLEIIRGTAESKLSSEQALEAIKKYCFANNPDLESMIGSDDHSIYWDVSMNEAGETVVLYRSYTGALIRYYIDPDSGDTYVTEQVPGISDEEQRTDESFNAREFLF